MNTTPPPLPEDREKLARKLLATEYEASGFKISAQSVRRNEMGPWELPPYRAILKALTYPREEGVELQITAVQAIIAEWEKQGHDEAHFNPDCSACRIIRALRTAVDTASAHPRAAIGEETSGEIETIIRRAMQDEFVGPAPGEPPRVEWRVKRAKQAAAEIAALSSAPSSIGGEERP